jgi:hypothetical protein
MAQSLAARAKFKSIEAECGNKSPGAEARRTAAQRPSGFPKDFSAR